jgi:hypothetical protein
MININRSWQLITLPYNDQFSAAITQQHHAVQFIATVGRHLISQQSDDSNTNMEFRKTDHTFLGNRLENGIRVGLNPIALILFIEDENGVVLKEIPLIEKNKNLIFEQLKEGLADLNIDVQHLKNELHYELPKHPLDNGEHFKISDQKYLKEATFCRFNAQSVMNEINDFFQNAAEIRIWPHHFDTGTYMPIASNKIGKMTRSIGFGWAIPDQNITEPYFYINYWSEGETLDFKKLPPPNYGSWINSGWQGGILSHSQMLDADGIEAQYIKVKTFFDSGIDILKTFVFR